MKKHFSLFLFILLIFLAITTKGQTDVRNKMIDSLTQLLKVYKNKCSQPCIADSFQVNMLNDLGYYLSLNKPDSGIYFNRKALLISESMGWIRGKTDALIKIGESYRLMGNYDSCIIYNEEVLKIYSKKEFIKTDKDLTNNGVAFYNIAFVKRESGNIADALVFYEKALTISELQNDRLRISNCYSSMGTAFDMVGKYQNALSYQLKSLKIKHELKLKRGIANAYGNIGIIYKKIKDYPSAIKYYNDALKEFEAIKDLSGQAISYNNIGESYMYENNLDLALNNYEKSLNLFKEAKAKGYVPIALSNIAGIYQKKKEYAKALQLHLDALELKRSLKSKPSICVSLLNIGSVFSDLNKTDSAEKYLLEAYSLADKNNFSDDKKDISEELYKLYSKATNYEKALFYYDKYSKTKDSLTIEENKNSIESQMLNFEFERKQDSIKAVQEKKLALAALEKRNALEQSEKKRLLGIASSNLIIAKTENQKILAESNLEISEANQKRTLSETENKIALSEAEKKIAITEADKKRTIAEADAKEQKSIRNFMVTAAAIIVLSSLFIFSFYKRKRDAEQKQKETSLNLQVSETEMKALRSQMNPHFIFNALQSIQTFLLSHQSEEANVYLLKFARLMRLVLENSQHSEVPLNEDMQALELYMQLESIRLQHPFTYQFHIDKSVDTENDSIPPLILQPFVENAIWHGLQYKPGPGHIDIYLSKNANALYATVEDNGVGRDMSKQVAQPMLVKKESLGMKLTEERLKILNELKKVKAQFSITDLFSNDNKPVGTKVELSLPLA